MAPQKTGLTLDRAPGSAKVVDYGGYAVTSAVSQLSLRRSAFTVRSPASSRMRPAGPAAGQLIHARRGRTPLPEEVLVAALARQ